MATLQRDQILNTALDLVGAPSLNTNDRPSSTILNTSQADGRPTALTVGWLRDILNVFAERYPWAQYIKTATITIAGGTATFTALPSDFILDVRDGIYLPAQGATAAIRLMRTSWQKMIDRQVYIVGPGAPKRYTILNPGSTGITPNVQIWPTPDVNYTATLAYYSRPSVLNPTDVPAFPSDEVLIEYIRIKGLEWVRAVELGSAQKYAEARLADVRKAGLGFEPEDDTIPFDRNQFLLAGDPNSWSWLGPFSNQI